MNQMTDVALSALKIHPQNLEYFDEATGDDYERLKESIKLYGIDEPLVVAADMTILSGHQRYKAARELDLPQISVIIRSDILSEDDKLIHLIMGNFGRGKNSEAKNRKAIAKYVEIRGYKNGEMGRGRGDEKEVQNGLPNKLTLDQIAAELGISKTELKRVLTIERNCTEDIKEMLDTGVFGKTFAADCIALMSPEEQEEFVKSLDATRHYTAKELQPYIDKIRKLEADVSNRKSEADEKLKSQVNNLQAELSQAQQDTDWYKKQFAEAQEKLDTMSHPAYEETGKYNGATDTLYLYDLIAKIQRLLDEDLSPLKFSRAIDAVNRSKTDRDAVLQILHKVAMWQRDIEQILFHDEVVDETSTLELPASIVVDA